jgi:8-oxo-dGTP pyrophosphatase MutT (NUDIX family)
MGDLDPRLHFVTATAIVAREEADHTVRFLIAKRSATEKAFPNKWTVPGGKLVRSEYENLPRSRARNIHGSRFAAEGT